MGKRRGFGIMVEGGWGDSCLIGDSSITELIDVDRREAAAEKIANLQHLIYLQSHDVVSAMPL